MTQIDHLGIAVKSLSEAKQFYQKLGLEVMPEETVEAEKVRTLIVVTPNLIGQPEVVGRGSLQFYESSRGGLRGSSGNGLVDGAGVG